MRKIAVFLIYCALIGFICTAIANLLHHRAIGAMIMVASCLLLVAGILCSLLAPGNAKANLSMSGGTRKSYIIGYIGVIVFITGVLLKKGHLAGGEYVLIAGLIIVLIFCIMVLYQVATYKKYQYKGAMTINPGAGELEQYLGVYYNDELKMELTVRKSRAGSGLEAQAKGQGAYELGCIEPNIFSCMEWGIVMEFRPSNREFILIQNGGYWHFRKAD